MPRGGRRIGAGRKPGSKIAKTAAIAISQAEAGTTPLEFVLAVMRDETQPLGMRLNCATAAMPFMHPRLANITQNIRRDDRYLADLLQKIDEAPDDDFMALPVIDVEPLANLAQ